LNPHGADAEISVGKHPLHPSAEVLIKLELH
jgi:hypothetical protein